MKNLFVIIFLSIACLAVWFINFNTACFVMLFVGAVLRVVYHYVDERLTLNFYAELYSDVFVISNHPDTDEECVAPEDLEAVIIHVPFREVAKTVLEVEAWLRKSGNVHYLDESLSDEQKLNVFGIIFRDGEYAAESWHKKFPKRVKREIKTRIIDRHTLLKEASLKKSTDTGEVDWYTIVSNKQILPK